MRVFLFAFFPENKSFMQLSTYSPTLNLKYFLKCIMIHKKIFETAMTTFFLILVFDEWEKGFPKGKKRHKRKVKYHVGVIFDEKLITRNWNSLSRCASSFILMENRRRQKRIRNVNLEENNKFIEKRVYIQNINKILLYFHYINWFGACYRVSMYISCILPLNENGLCLFSCFPW